MRVFERPNTIIGLLVRLLRARRLVGVTLGGLCLLAAITTGTVGALRGCPLEPMRVATFNIEDFPKSERQVEGAFEVIGELGSPIIAVQEITDPVAFSRAAHEKLGRAWRFVYNRRGGRQKLGVLFDSERLDLVRTRQHDDTTLGEGHRPVLEVVLDPIDGDRRTRIVVVHLKAGGESVPIRRRQIEALERVLERVLGSEDRVVVLGDFNATSPEDRAAIFDMAERTEMVWLSESLECTSYWERPDECQGSALDHVLIEAIPFSIAARGPCETEGCDTRESCPIFHGEVSDHCPVVAEIF